MVETTPPLICVVPPASVVTLVNCAAFPTGAENVVLPVLLATRLLPPFTAPVNVMLPLPVEFRLVPVPRVTASL